MPKSAQRKVKLDLEWVIGERIGSGGFGQVFAAQAQGQEPAVIKLVPKEPGADRELLFTDLKGIRNVVPVIDRGEVGDAWAIVMPRAKRSLRQHLDQGAGALSFEEARTIILDVGRTLADLDGKVVHRDLKPENILLLDGHWCLADFGISRYAEMSTAPDTHKYSMSPPYAAPERWRAERATAATDIYSLGVLAFELLSGGRPFKGPEPHDFRHQHLNEDAPTLRTAPPIRALVGECLYKAPGARPTAANLVARIEQASRPARLSGLASLEEANLAEVARLSESDRQASAARSASEIREQLFKGAERSLMEIGDALFSAIADAAPSAAQATGRAGGRTLRLGQAQIELIAIGETGLKPWEWQPPTFDVVAQSGIIVRFEGGRHGYGGRSHSLWFCDAQVEGQYKWFETAFMFTPLINRSSRMEPFLLNPSVEAAKALWNGVAEFQLAWPLSPLDLGDLDEFIDRWADWFAKASQGNLAHPHSMPERATPRNWRQQ